MNHFSITALNRTYGGNVPTLVKYTLDDISRYWRILFAILKVFSFAVACLMIWTVFNVPLRH